MTLSVSLLWFLGACAPPDSRTPDASTPNATPSASANAVLVLPLEEGRGVATADTSNSGNDGTLVGSPRWGQGGLVFDSNDDRVHVDPAPNLSLRELTIATWLKADRLREWDGILTAGVNAAPYTLQIGSSGRVRFTAEAKRPAERHWDSNTSLTLSRWHHVAVTYDGTRLRFYVDGVADSAQPSAQIALSDVVQTLTIGAHLPYGGEYFRGALRDVRVYDGALSANEIAAIATETLAPQAIGAFLDGRFPSQPPGSNGAGPIEIVPAFPQLAFDDPLVIRPAPNSNRLFVGSRQGVIHSFVNTPNVAGKDLFLDLSDRCAEVWDGGFLGLAFHPEFGQAGSPNRGYVYTYYTYTPDGDYPRDFTGGFFGVYLRLSRFHVPDGSLQANRWSETVMFHMRLFNGSHRGGDIAFGPDGFLYVPVGDQFRYSPAQELHDNLVGGVLRIDVDQNPARSHAPRRTLPLAYPEEFSGRHYWIPNDNPFLEPGGTRFEEYFSVGHRNPHRMTFDATTGRIWSGEIGENAREEINVIEKGHNYGWPFREGMIAGGSPRPPVVYGIVTDPVTDFDRTEANAIIGGYVYRGSRLPELYGKYVCGDHRQKRVWALTYDANSGTASKDLLTTFLPGDLATFGYDRDNEIYLGGLGEDVPIYTLAREGSSGGEAPRLLSQTGAFSDLANLTPARGVLPYDLNAPFWSDGAFKHRWIAIPNDGAHDSDAETIVFAERGDWSFPTGTVLIKHFELAIDDLDPSVTRKLETRFLVITAPGEFYGVTYRWRPDGSDADLLSSGMLEDIAIRTVDGGTRTQRWTYPSNTDCLNCHQAGNGGVLGPSTHQLNGTLAYPGGPTDNQLRVWNRLGWFRSPLDIGNLAGLPRATAVADLTEALADRARSYLDSNCASCHRPQTGNRGHFDARSTTPLAGSGLLHGTVLDNLGINGATLLTPGLPEKSIAWIRTTALDGRAMPPLAKNIRHEAGVELLRQWIWSLSPQTRSITLGHPIEDQPDADDWFHNMIVDEGSSFTNTTGQPLELRVEAFRFHAARVSGSITPFVVQVLGNNTFVVAAIGTPRSEADYRAGENSLRFADDAATTLVLQPGQTIAAGFLDARPDGSGGATGGIVAYCTCNPGNEVWHTGGWGTGDGGRVAVGAAPVPGTQIVSRQRHYSFAVDLCQCDAPVRAELGNAGGLANRHESSAWEIVINEGDRFTNDSTGPLEIAIESFRFDAAQSTGSIIPFVARYLGNDNFAVRAVGSTRVAGDGLVIGDNRLSFHRAGPYPLTLAPGETVVAGFLHTGFVRFADGGDETWRLGADTFGPRGAARDYAFAVRLRRVPLGPTVPLGQASAGGSQLDSWPAQLLVDTTQTYVNRSGAPQTVAVYRFRFRAQHTQAPITPFVVKVDAPDQFRVVAIGTTIEPGRYRVGGNIVPFLEGGPAEVVLGAGETLAIGFASARPDGSGAARGAIPYANFGRVWRTGGTSVNDAGRVEYGLTPARGRSTGAEARRYSFAVDLEIR